MQKEYESAYAFFKQALDIDIQLLHSSHPSLGLDFDDIGDVYNGLGDYGKAKSYYNKSLEIFVKNNGYEHSHTKLLLNKINELNDR
jgi:tetratricopeptide (TPR) repeat protein